MERIAQAGDYVADRPILLGSIRTGPDLSQAGGEHPDDWHITHFINPRYTRPNSIMPPWEFLGKEKIETLTRYVQGLGFKMADRRMQRQQHWKAESIKAYGLPGRPDAGRAENCASPGRRAATRSEQGGQRGQGVLAMRRTHLVHLPADALESDPSAPLTEMR